MNGKLDKNKIAVIIGIVLVFFGVWRLFLHVFGSWYGEIWRVFSTVVTILWPVVIIVIGILLIIAARGGKLKLPANKRLFRSTKSKKVAGVCGGIAEYLSADPVVVRLVTIVLGILCVYIVVPLYLLLWIIVPPDTKNYGNWV
jgi:phage shock protein PspC (stress-responsive transcriptional regulator)